jgi:uncharacterized protein (TIGR00290 family)
MKEIAYFNWSSGKDSALALYYLQMQGQTEIKYLLTSMNAHYDRVSMHGLRRSLLEAQLTAIGLPYTTVELPEQPDMNTYEKAMGSKVAELKLAGCTSAVFGDIFLEDLRQYRETQLAAAGIKALFPLWQRNTRTLLQEFIATGFKAIVICADATRLDASFCGRELDKNFLQDLPAGVDPCGENGEYHTFCYDGPIFTQPVPFVKGEKIYREYRAGEGQKTGFWFCDLLPVKEL